MRRVDRNHLHPATAGDRCGINRPNEVIDGLHLLGVCSNEQRSAGPINPNNRRAITIGPGKDCFNARCEFHGIRIPDRQNLHPSHSRGRCFAGHRIQLPGHLGRRSEFWTTPCNNDRIQSLIGGNPHTCRLVGHRQPVPQPMGPLRLAELLLSKQLRHHRRHLLCAGEFQVDGSDLHVVRRHTGVERVDDGLDIGDLIRCSGDEYRRL